MPKGHGAGPGPAIKPRWTFLTNHGHVLLVLARNPQLVLRKVAEQVGITERAVQRIVADLEEAGYVERKKVGRQNHYRIHEDKPLRHPVEQPSTIAALIRLVFDHAHRDTP